MQHTLQEDLISCLQLEQRGVVAIESVLLGMEFAQQETMALQDTVPSGVHDFDNDIVLQTLLVSTNNIQFTDTQYTEIADRCLTHVRSDAIISKITTFRYANGTKMVDVHQYHACNFSLPSIQSLAVRSFTVATLYLSSRPVLSVLFAALK